MKISLIYIFSLIFISTSTFNLTGKWDVKKTSGYYSKVTNMPVTRQPEEMVAKTVWNISSDGKIEASLDNKKINVGQIQKNNNKIILRIGQSQPETTFDIKSINSNKIIFEYKSFNIEQLTIDTN